MICSQCKNHNPIGNKFCRECGGPLTQPTSPLAQEDITQADHERLSERVAGLLSAAFTLAEQKRFDQALPIAEEAVTLLPNSTSALSLLATLFEQTGQNARAIAVMERVVSINPESPADREKLDFLRRKPVLPVGTVSSPGKRETATQSEATTRRIPSWAPALLGASAAACVFGIWLSMNNQRNQKPVAALVPVVSGTPAGQAAPAGEMPASTRSEAQLASAAAPPVDTPRGGTGIAPAELTRPDPFSSLNAPASPTIRERAPVAPTLPALRIAANRPGRNSTDFPSSSGGSGDSTETASTGGTLAPIIAVPPPPAANGQFGATQSGASAGSRSNGGDQGTLEMSPGANGAPAPTPTPYIRITVGASGNAASGASPSRNVASGGSSDSGTDALSRARHLQSSGRYSDAIGAYQQSLAAGNSNSGEVQQGIGQSYARLGNEQAARSAYRDAIRAFQAQSAAGRNVSAAEHGIQACKAALEVLGGD